MRFLFLALLLIIYCSHSASGTVGALIEKYQLPASLKAQVNHLRSQGMEYYDEARYMDAVKCYSAVLQLIEGLAGEEAYELRRRCGLNLAQCELKSQRYSAAIARCSEVIEESLNHLEDSLDTASASTKASSSSVREKDKSKNASLKPKKLLLQSLQKAHHRRGKALQALHRSDLAEVDFNFERDYAQSLSSLSSLKTLPTLPRRTPSHLLDQLRDFTDDCQVSEPRLSLSPAELKRLLSPRVPDSHTPRVTQTLGSPFGNLGGLFGDLSSSSGNNLNPQQLKFKFSHMIRSFGPILGLSPALSRTLSQIVGVLESGYDVIRVVVQKIEQHKEVVLLSLTLLWALYYYYTSQV